MGGSPLVTFDGVWKKFHRGERHDSLRDLIPSLARRFRRPPAGPSLDSSEFWALKDVSFEVRAGEALGIIGQNGAGKSTALKTLTKILRPSRGACRIRGRAGALIEVAAGFHPELTGRENVYLQGAIMGMKRGEIAERLDAILDFADVGPFVDTPVKRYSSGMNARLGFAVAAHLNPDVLIIDEVLAVGDIAFQEKCERRMLEFKKSGVALVFVSHNLAAVTRLCERTLLLQEGAPVALGPSEAVIEQYVASTTTGRTPEGRLVQVTVPGRPRGADGLRCNPGDQVTFDVDLEFMGDVRAATLAFSVWSFRTGSYVYEARSHQAGIDMLAGRAGDRRRLRVSFGAHLTRGLYRVDLRVLAPPDHDAIGSQKGALVLTVVEHRSQNGVANLDLNVEDVDSADEPESGAGRPETRLADSRPH